MANLKYFLSKYARQLSLEEEFQDAKTKDSGGYVLN
jgi:hypothetical protein